jgi:hypothetical protein
MDNKEETPIENSKHPKKASSSTRVTRSQTIDELRESISIIEEINKIMFAQFNCKEKTHVEKMFAISLEVDELLIKRINKVMNH